MFKISRGKFVFIVPNYWLDSWGYLKPEAVCILKVFFKDKTNEEADEELEKRLKSTGRGRYAATNF